VDAPPPLRLDHVVVPVRDAGEARAFYRDVLGLPLVAALSGDDWGGRPWLMMVYAVGSGGQHIVAVAFAGERQAVVATHPRDARHNAFSVDSEEAWRRWRARLAGARADFWEESHGDQRSLYVVDPSGNVLEITTPETPPFVTANEPPDAVADSWMAAHAGHLEP
jgi:catechol 2,3-dioxygenase-like lactoylglutathione lyase family enzyme